MVTCQMSRDRVESSDYNGCLALGWAGQKAWVGQGLPNIYKSGKQVCFLTLKGVGWYPVILTIYITNR